MEEGNRLDSLQLQLQVSSSDMLPEVHQFSEFEG